MNIQQVKAMMELQALGNLGSIASSSSEGTNSFQTILDSALQTTGNDTLGSIQNLLDAMPQMPNSPSLPHSQERDVNQAPGTGFDSIISRAAERYGIPAKLVHSVVKQESGYNPEATSHAGAAGLMQLMPGTARGLGVTDIYDPEQNVFAGAKYLKQMLVKYDGDMKLALAAYNAGPGNVDKYSGVPPFQETQNYVRKIMDSYYA
ncbi:lytic transglycosylase domain-containing protein [Rossellomorea marisflavi]|uniref:lytic transglycosylase domain-containing protein n=1 Tax=Rossellomorea marisflavi TaxID=189381 RepID=UPI00064E1E2F|nr:lytic transglycosylase domain-containing protein [Rossellomorea marisflavi]KML06185.1 lytic transglycosylase [Rossellomorea marisflavi]QHA35889.1 transglycosylase SLT domain-containing protein [Rossellomorea marisflavi]